MRHGHLRNIGKVRLLRHIRRHSDGATTALVDLIGDAFNFVGASRGADDASTGAREYFQLRRHAEHCAVCFAPCDLIEVDDYRDSLALCVAALLEGMHAGEDLFPVGC